MSKSTDERETPQYVFDALNELFHFEIDAAASDTNHKCKLYYTKYIDGLVCEWNKNTFINPPYSHGQIEQWINKAIKETKLHPDIFIIMLLPSDTSTKWFELLWNNAKVILFLKGRLAFSYDTGAKFGSIIVSFKHTTLFEKHLLLKGRLIYADNTL